MAYFAQKDEDLTVEIYNLSGQVIEKKIYTGLPEGASTTEINLGEISNGIYFVKFITSNNREVHKLTIANN